MSTPAFAGGPAVAGLRAGAVLLDRYELRERLERGTPDHADSGAVWRAHDLLLRRDVALRSLRTSAGRDPAAARERAHREGRAAARVHHPGLAAIYDMADLDGDVVLVTELLRGPSLAQVLATTGRLPYRRSASVGAQLADGLAAAHTRGVVHGDVGPATVLLGVDDDGTLDDGAALAGLGVAGVDAAEGFAEGVVGRLRAPETLHGAPVSPASDVWALGATLHLAVTGRPPGPGGVDRAAGPVAGLLAAMLAPDPFARPDAGQVRVALEGVVDGLAEADAVTSPAAMPPVSPAPVPAHAAPAASSGTAPDLAAAALNPPTRTWTPRTDPRPAARDRRRLVRTGVVGAGLLAVGAVGVAATSLPDTAPTAGSTAAAALPAAPPAVDAPITPVEPEPPISAVPMEADPVLTAATESRQDRAERREREREARAERREQREEREDRRDRDREDRDDDRGDRDDRRDRDRDDDRGDRGDRDDDRGDRDSDRDSDRGDRDSDD